MSKRLSLMILAVVCLPVMRAASQDADGTRSATDAAARPAGGAVEPAPPADEPLAPLNLPTAPLGGLGTMHRGVVGGPHDFSGPTGVMANACAACHVPHVQAVRVVSATQPATQPAAEMFRIGGQRRVFVPGRYMPGPTSLICLGCHDGTIATSTIGSAHAMLAGVREGFAVPDGYAWRDHPIGIPYPEGKKGYRPLAFVAKTTIRLPEGRIECISCHDPHNDHGHEDMLVMSNRRSALCLTCHVK